MLVMRILATVMQVKNLSRMSNPVKIIPKNQQEMFSNIKVSLNPRGWQMRSCSYLTFRRIYVLGTFGKFFVKKRKIKVHRLLHLLRFWELELQSLAHQHLKEPGGSSAREIDLCWIHLGNLDMVNF